MNETQQSRREFIVRATAGLGAVAVGTVAVSAWARTANAASANAASANAAIAPMNHAGMHGMVRASSADMSNMQAEAQQAAQQPAGAAGVVNMDGDFYKPVRLAAKPNAVPLLDKKQIEDFERTIACPCPCTLDVFTCRTTDFSCGNSPAVHADVQALVKGGYSADEIMQAMIGVYGNNILMAPPKSGINLIAWFAPFAALAAGAIVLNAMLRGWRRNSEMAAVRASSTAMIKPADVDATDDEMARLHKAMRDDSR